MVTEFPRQFIAASNITIFFQIGGETDRGKSVSDFIAKHVANYGSRVIFFLPVRFWPGRADAAGYSPNVLVRFAALAH